MFSPAWGLYTFAVVIVLIIIAMVYFSKSSTLTQFDPENMMFTTFQVDGMDDRIGLFAENTPPGHLCKVLQLSIDDSDGNNINVRDVIRTRDGKYLYVILLSDAVKKHLFDKGCFVKASCGYPADIYRSKLHRLDIPDALDGAVDDLRNKH
eukprot:826591_1